MSMRTRSDELRRAVVDRIDEDDVVAPAPDLGDIPSLTGAEGAAAERVHDWLAGHGFAPRPVGPLPDRLNVAARAGDLRRAPAPLADTLLRALHTDVRLRYDQLRGAPHRDDRDRPRGTARVSDIGIGLAQFGVEPLAAEESRERSVSAAREGFEQGADIVVLPELIVPGYSVDWRGLRPLAETLDGPTVRAWAQAAADGDGYVVGGFCERDGEALYDSAVVVGPEGPILHYRKLHLFDQEKVAFRPGNLGLPVAHTRFGTIGVCICYDLRFVETVRILALRGADLICVPTAWLPGFDDQRWDADGMCPQAHGAVLQANLNQVFIAAASQAGRHGGLDFLGSSIVADPLGARVAGPLPGSEHRIVVTRVDPGAAKAARIRSPLITPRADRRTDVYGLAVEDELL